MSELRVGYLGLGLMGKPMARNILKAGFDLTVWNRSPEKCAELQAMGAKVAANPPELARNCDVVITNVSDTPDVLQVTLGEGGLIEGLHPGLIIVDNSTIKPAASRSIYQTLKEHGVAYLDAPVSGGTLGAENRNLTIMVGGDAEPLEKVLPVLQAMGKSVTHVGASGAGQIAKAANQIMVAAQMIAEAELLVLAQKAGADPVKVIEAIKGGAAQCWTLDVKPQRLFAGNRAPGFKASLQAKDLNIVMETAREYLVGLPVTALNTQLFNAMVAYGEGDLDNSAILGTYERMNDVFLQVPEEKQD